MIETISLAFSSVFQPSVFLAIASCAVYGIFMGAIPGLTATMAVALLVPMTFFLDDVTALSAIVTLEACAIFAGDIPTVLLRIPGTPSSAAYVDEAHAWTRLGKHQEALGVCLLFSFAGGLLGAGILFLFAPSLARVATEFTSFEYFWLTLLGLSCAAIVSRGNPLKGALALVLGLLFSMVGLSEVHSVPRFTFGRDELIAGVNFIPAMIGLFGMSEVLKGFLLLGKTSQAGSYSEKGIHEQQETWGESVRKVFREAVPLFMRRKVHSLRSGLIGFLVGMLPGAGADIGAWISYAFSKRLSGKASSLDHSSLSGVGDATCANNAALAGAWVPALVFGIPGDSITAIVIGVLLMKNVLPGPQIFNNPEQSVLVYGIFITFVLANLVLLPVGFLAIKSGGLLIRVPKQILLPCILLFCVVGAYSTNGSYFDVWVMLILGALGAFLERNNVPLGPVVLGIILGARLEETFIQSVTKSHAYWDFVTRPISGLLAVLCLALWLAPLVAAFLRHEKSRS